MTYFLYAQANPQLSRLPIRSFQRFQESNARAGVIKGLRVPQREVSQQSFGANAGFHAGLSVGGSWTRFYVDNPHAAIAGTLIQLFNDAPASWDRQQRLWHLSSEYKADHEWARNEDRFHFSPAFYQDPYSHTVSESPN